MRYRVIALDLDGTLLTSGKTILPESLAALQRARAAGAKVLIVTGRHHVAIHPFYQALELDTPAICCNGTYLYDYAARNVLTSDSLPVDKAEQLITLLETYGIEGLMYVDDAMLYQPSMPAIDAHVARTQKWAETLPDTQRPLFVPVDSFRQAARDAQSVWKFALIGKDLPALHQFADTVTRELSLNCEWSWHDQVDVMQTGNSKGARLAQWVASQGLRMDDVIAFGDNRNDISMLSRAGLGVAMGNASDIVKASADITIGTNEQPSIADTLAQYGL